MIKQPKWPPSHIIIAGNNVDDGAISNQTSKSSVTQISNAGHKDVVKVVD